MDKQYLFGGEKVVVRYVEEYVQIESASVAGACVNIPAQVYTGKALKPKPKVSVDGFVLREGIDYTLRYTENIAPGKAKLYIYGTGDYCGVLKVPFQIILAMPAVKIAAVSAAAVKLSWNKVPCAQYYRVYEYQSKTKKYTPLAKVTGTSAVCKNLAAGSAHFYLVKACCITRSGAEVCSTFTAKDHVKAVALCKAPAVKASAAGKTVQLKWGKCAGAAFYRVYEYNAKTKKYTTLIKSTANTAVKLTKRTKGTHYYLIRAFNTGGVGSAYSAKNQVKVIVK